MPFNSNNFRKTDTTLPANKGRHQHIRELTLISAACAD
jgi:hypothetical protein